MKKVLFAHDFRFKIKEESLYTAVGLPEVYFDRFFDAGFHKVDIVSRYNQYNGNIDTGFVKINSSNIKILKSFSRNYLYLFNPLNIYKISRLMDKYDLIVCSTPSIIGSWVLLINLFQKKKYSVEVAGDYDMFSTKKFGFIITYFLKNLMPKFIKNANGATYVTNDLSRRFPNNNSLVASNVNIKKVFYKESVTQALKFKETIEIGYIGALTKRKGISILIEFANKLVEMNIRNFQINLIGGHSDDDWKEKVSELKIDKYFVFHGILDSKNVDLLLKRLDLYIQPSFSEGLPRATIEAMSNGLPVIATTLPGFKELLEDDYLFEHQDINKMLDIFNNLINSIGNYNLQSKRNSNFAKSFLYDVLHEKRKTFYNNLLEKDSI
ncbi:glycosyltransferase family 4 protein [Aliarcobacter butzleri]|uniref:glycosyltransferase family 4 protein n=1 Tax=Aliarcobacter butzleri TaxID=28197 RepID=UPI00125EB955|nr:glycosyltransferase family 4 protein [Aliarcobacter butzleri]